MSACRVSLAVGLCVLFINACGGSQQVGERATPGPGGSEDGKSAEVVATDGWRETESGSVAAEARNEWKDAGRDTGTVRPREDAPEPEPSMPAVGDESAELDEGGSFDYGGGPAGSPPPPPRGSVGHGGGGSSGESYGGIGRGSRSGGKGKTRAKRAEPKKERRRDYDDRMDIDGLVDKAGPGVARPDTTRVRPTRVPAISAPSIKAGRHDDNKQYNRFLTFLGDNEYLMDYPVDVSERLVLRLRDKNGKSLHNCSVEFKSLKGKVLAKARSFADGSTQFFPSDAAPAGEKEFTVRADCGKQTRNGQLARGGKRDTELHYTFSRSVPRRVPVDIAIVLDTTGSMQSQIDRLKTTLKAIHFQLTQLTTKPDIRFALVAYRDQGDEYITRPYQFTDDVKQFQEILDGLDADGGGDTPEDLQAGLDDAMHKLRWRKDALRIGFIVADAVPHTDYGQKFTYRSAMREGLERGIKWVGVGAGGLPRKGEVIFRQIAQFTMGEYVFITQGAVGNSEGGVGEASHHVGTNYKPENLDQAIVRIVRRELSYLTDKPKDVDDTIVATAKPGVPRNDVLAPAVSELLRQLTDYSSMRLEKGTRTGIIPCKTAAREHAGVAEYISEQMTLSASRNAYLKLVEKDMQHLSGEIRRQLTDVFDLEKSVAIGKLLGAEVLIVSKLMVTSDGASLFGKLVRVETGEILSVAKVDMDTNVINAS